MKSRKTGAVTLFLGLLLIVIFGVGLTVEQNPTALMRPKMYDYAMESFGDFCASIWLPAGIIGIPLFVVSLIINLIRERKSKDQ